MPLSGASRSTIRLLICGYLFLGVWITVFLVLIIIVNIFGAIGYAEEEFWASLLKLFAICIFMVTAFILVVGGGPKSGRYGEYWGARLWYSPGAFRNGFRGFCSVFVTAAFSFSGTELVGLAAAESENPVKSLPGAIKQVFWRITLFYVLGLFFVGLLVSSDDPHLLGASSNDVSASPFVLIGQYAGLNGYNDFMNVIILVSVLSIGVSSVYGGSRCLTALGQQGYAPKIFTYIDKSGRPLFSVAVILAFGLLGYISLGDKGSEVFDWLQAVAGLAALFTWGSICLAHIRFRSAWKYHGHTLDEIPFKALGGVYGSWIGLVLVVLVLIAQVSASIGRTSVTTVVPVKSKLTSQRSSTLPSPLQAAASTTRPASSSRIWPYPSCWSSGLAATCGSARGGSRHRRSMWTATAASSTGTPCARPERSLLPCRPGSGCCILSSERLECFTGTMSWSDWSVEGLVSRMAWRATCKTLECSAVMTL
jgi:amino acid permease